MNLYMALTIIIALGGVGSIVGAILGVLHWRGKRFEKRPDIKLVDLVIDTNEFEIYAGKDVVKFPGANPIEKYIDIVTNPGKLNQTTLLYPNEHSLSAPNSNNIYMLVNLCSEEDIEYIDDKNDIVLAFGVLNIMLKLDVDKIRSLKIDKAYSMRTKTKSFGEGLEIDVKLDEIPEFRNRKELKIPVAYAFTDSMPTSIHVTRINKLKNESVATDGTKLCLSESQAKIGKYISFHETAYLLKCQSLDSLFPYYYSVFLSKKRGKLNNPEREYRKKLFNTKAKEACRRAGFNVIKKSVK